MDFSLHLVFAVTFFVVGTLGQRPPYVSGPLEYPGVLPQYQTSTSDPLDNKFGEDSPTTVATSTSTVTALPGSIYEQDLINRVPEWPEDKRPFWFINNQYIQNHTGFRPQQNQQGQQQPPRG